MKYVICAVRDEVAQSFLTPLTFEVSEERAIRNFESSFLSAQAQKVGLFYSHPSDFSLFAVGEFEDADASFTSCVPRLLRKGGEV